MNTKFTLPKLISHLRIIHTHRKWVFYYCRRAGIPWRGLTHDLSKYSIVELVESVRFYTGTESPISVAKREQGFSRAWLHHRGRNPHHWAYWADNFSEGFTVYPMPKNDFVEMVCDFLAAGRAYSSATFSDAGEYAWGQREREGGQSAMNEKNKKMLDIIFSDLAQVENPLLVHMMPDRLKSPEELIKSGYIQHVWYRNK